MTDKSPGNKTKSIAVAIWVAGAALGLLAIFLQAWRNLHSSTVRPLLFIGIAMMMMAPVIYLRAKKRGDE